MSRIGHGDSRQRGVELGRLSAIPAGDPGVPPTALDLGEYIPTPITVHIRDAGANRVAQVDDYVSLELTMRHADVGGWILTMHPDSPGTAAFLAVIGTDPLTGIPNPVGHTGIEITRGTAVIFSGPVATVRRTRQGSTDRIILAGPDDNAWLLRRLAMPEPATAYTTPGTAYPTNAYDVRSGVASTVLLGYANANGGPGALTARRVPELVMAADPLVGASLPGQQARFQTLLELEQAVALAGGDLGFRTRSDGAGTLTFTVYAPADRTATIKITDGIGNLGDFDLQVTAPTGDYVVVGGGGEGTARYIYEQGDSDAITRWGRFEYFRDRRDTSDPTQIAGTAAEEQANHAESTAITITTRDTPQMAFGKDYDLGDQVAAVITGIEIAEIVREVHLMKTPTDGEIWSPTIATASAGKPGLPQLFQRQRSAATRILNLERR